MPSLSSQKLIRKLRQRKNRWSEELFVAEGPKLIKDLLDSGLKAQEIWSTKEWEGAKEISVQELGKLSHLSTANQALAIFPFPKVEISHNCSCLILDGINDPGNLGTLLRTADWFGFQRIICSPGTADIYNAKTVQSTMGSLARLRIDYLSVDDALSSLGEHRIFVAEMVGQNFSEIELEDGTPIALVMGSESHGPSQGWLEVAEKITIPRPANSEIDSLNVAIAGGILMQHFA